MKKLVIGCKVQLYHSWYRPNRERPIRIVKEMLNYNLEWTHDPNLCSYLKFEDSNTVESVHNYFVVEDPTPTKETKMLSKTVTVEQCNNPKLGSLISKVGDPAKVYDSDEYVYRVIKLKNIVTPHINEYVKQDQLNGLISSGVEVNIVPCK